HLDARRAPDARAGSLLARDAAEPIAAAAPDPDQHRQPENAPAHRPPPLIASIYYGGSSLIVSARDCTVVYPARIDGTKYVPSVSYNRRTSMRHASPIVLTDEEKAALEALVASGATPQRFAVRARLVLLAARGLTNEKIASRLKMGRVAVGRWRDRYARARLAGIERDAPGRGRKASITPERVTEVVRLTQQSKPKGRTHWSRTSMAERAGMSESS